MLFSIQFVISLNMNTFFYNIHTLFLSLSFLLLFPSANSISFQRTRFEPTDTTIIYEGGATPFVGAIELNNDAYQCQVGRATYTEKILLWDSHTQKLSDFSTSFSSTVDIQRRPIYHYGSGFTFFLASLEFQIPVNSAGGFLGLYNITSHKSSSRSQIVHIEFDSQPDSEWDPLFEHVGININSLSSVVYTPWNVTLHSSDTIDVWISYNGSTKNLTVSWKFRLTAISQEITSLSYIIDLRKVLPQWVKIGFSAATRDYVERHAVYSWEFSSSLESEESKQSNNKKIEFLILIIGIVIIGLVVIAIGVWWGRKLKGGKTEKMNLNSIIKDLEKEAGLQRFSYNDLASATRNFSNESKLGEGESATTVYKGSLTNLNMAVAVKKFKCGSKQGKKRYINEVTIISRLEHPNLVKLIGCCHEKGEFLLVYEFISNGNLESHLFGKKRPLTWSVRYKIVLELASVLLYLHEEWEQCVGHGNIKSSNIMLDSSFNVKICDFGLAQLMDHELGSETMAIDVHGFGLIALEIATGRKILDPIEEQHNMSSVDWVWDLYRNETLNLAIDKKLNNVFDVKQIKCLMIVGLWCAHPDHSLRPSIRQAIHVLNFDSTLPKLCTSGQ